MTREEEKQAILSEEWPWWPLLPMKRWVGERSSFDNMEEGILVAGMWTTVFKANIVTLALSGVNITEALKITPVVNYESLDAMLADGWHGD